MPLRYGRMAARAYKHNDLAVRSTTAPQVSGTRAYALRPGGPV